MFLEHFGEKNADGEWEIPPGTLSVMTSMINVGELVGSLSAAPLNDYFGRKGVFMVGTVAIIVGVILQLVTTSSRDLMTAGRAILGFGVGNFSATSPLYMAVSYTSRRISNFAQSSYRRTKLTPASHRKSPPRPSEARP